MSALSIRRKEVFMAKRLYGKWKGKCMGLRYKGEDIFL